MTKPSLRTYILVVGRKADGERVRKLAPYKVPVAGLTDDYQHMTAAELRSMEAAIKREQGRIAEALTDIRVETYDRLERIK
jgi:hypothetical protein